MVLFHKADDALAYAVIACLADKGCIKSCTPQRNKSVEHRTSRNSSNGLLVFKDNVEYCFSYSYYFSHVFGICGCKYTKKNRNNGTLAQKKSALLAQCRPYYIALY